MAKFVSSGSFFFVGGLSQFNGIGFNNLVGYLSKMNAIEDAVF